MESDPDLRNVFRVGSKTGKLLIERNASAP